MHKSFFGVWFYFFLLYVGPGTLNRSLEVRLKSRSWIFPLNFKAELYNEKGTKIG